MFVLINYSDNNIMRNRVELTNNLLKSLRIKYIIINQKISNHKYQVEIYHNM